MVMTIDSVLSLIFLIIIEIILGIDNIIFLAILTERLPENLRSKVRAIGLFGAWVLRIILLFSALWISKIQQPLFMLYTIEFSLSGLFFIFGGLFLAYQAVVEIGNELDFLERKDQSSPKTMQSLAGIILQVMLMDLVFSFDSILTAIGVSKVFFIMAIAVTASILAMFYATEVISKFIHKYPSIKMLALAFLIIIGVFLIAEGLTYEISRNYLYFAMFFSFLVEGLNLLYKHRKRERD